MLGHVRAIANVASGVSPVVSSVIIFTLVGLIAALPGCGGLPKEAVQRIEKANEQYASRKYPEAVRQLNMVIARHPKTKGVAKAYYIRGLCHYQQRQDDRARSDFLDALGTSPDDDLSARCNAQIGHVAYQNDNFATAAEYYAKALKSYADSAFADDVCYRYGDCLQKLGNWRRSREVLPKVWTLFPDSELAGYARLKFAWPHDYFVIQCGAFTRSDLAQEMVKDLRGRGLDAAAQPDTRRTDQIRHVVYVGRYVQFAEAQTDLPRVQRIAPNAYIVP